MTSLLPNRSILHCMEPIGMGTSEAESLTSYFCRLANSHSCSTMDLSQFIIDQIAPERWATYLMAEGKSRFVWYQRSISGVGISAQLWAEILSRLTSVPNLQQLTLHPMQPVMASMGLMSMQERWCPHCLQEDLQTSKTPYFRLAWDIGVNKICREHHADLIEHCHHCKAKNVRHSASYVTPGWCTACKEFLGCPAPEFRPAPCDTELNRTREIEGLVTLITGAGCSPDLEALHQTIDTLVHKLDKGVGVHFAKRVGVRKSSVHYWKNTRSQLTFEALLQISQHCGIELIDLIRGDLSRSVAPEHEPTQKTTKSRLSFARVQVSTQHDWDSIRARLRQELTEQGSPKSVAEMSRLLNINKRSLYIYASQEAQLLGQRYLEHRRIQSKANHAESLAALESACKFVHSQGYGISARLIRPIVGEKIINKTRNLYSMLSRMSQEMSCTTASSLDSLN